MFEAQSFPALAATRHAKYITDTFSRIDKAIAERFLIKAEYIAITGRINDALSEAFYIAIKKNILISCQAGRRFYTYKGIAFTEVEDKLDISYFHPTVALISGKAKKITAIKGASELKTDFLAFFDEVKPLIEAIISLKSLIGKKPPKVDPVLAYVAPAASQKAAKAVYEALAKVVDANYQKLIAYFLMRHKADVEAFEAAQPISIHDHTVIKDEHDRAIGFKSSRDTLVRVYAATPNAMHVVGPCLATDYEDRLAQYANDSADYQRKVFLYKNMTKMDSVLERREDGFESAEVIEQSLDLLQASVRVTFFNGDQFVARTQIVNVWDVPNPFTRYPLTFHDVELGGKHHAMLSEQEMNTIFVKA